ncbi:MAG: vWA domain-containing protein [Thermodesulfovibrionales bacterium]|nr:vWA domain-containing protein [Thermodesulfovibrionales bacterium]
MYFCAFAEDKDGSAILILMDSSGSMKKTDPQNYRKPAARLFVSLLRENNRVGIVSFGDSAKELIPLTQNSRTNQNKIFNVISRVSSNEFSTNITDAVKKGFDILRSSPEKNRILLLMSDGKLALGSEEKDDEALEELTNLLPELREAGIRLYSIAFTDMSDAALLENMAKETGGFFRLAREDKDLHVIFASIFEKLKSPDTIPLEGDVFNIDRDINEVILIITKKNGATSALIDPSNKKYMPKKHSANMQWFESDIFDMITVNKPTVGKWKVKLTSNEGNKIFVITNLNLKSSFDKSFVKRGDRIQVEVWLEREGGVLKEKDVIEQISFFGEVVVPDGKGTKVNLIAASGNEEGKYQGDYIVANTGEHSLKIAAEGKTFKREKVFQFMAAEPPPPQPAATKKAAESSMRGKDTPKTASWVSVFIKLGLINISLLIIAGIIYITRKKFLNKTKKERVVG